MTSKHTRNQHYNPLAARAAKDPFWASLDPKVHNELNREADPRPTREELNAIATPAVRARRKTMATAKRASYPRRAAAPRDADARDERGAPLVTKISYPEMPTASARGQYHLGKPAKVKMVDVHLSPRAFAFENVEKVDVDYLRRSAERILEAVAGGYAKPGTTKTFNALHEQHHGATLEELWAAILANEIITYRGQGMTKVQTAKAAYDSAVTQCKIEQISLPASVNPRDLRAFVGDTKCGGKLGKPLGLPALRDALIGRFG